MDANGLTDQSVLAELVGKHRTLIGKYLTLVNLPPEVQASENQFSLGLAHWLEIAKLPKAEDQVRLAQECAEKDYSVRELQARVKQLLKPEAEQAKTPKPEPAVYDWAGQEFRFIPKGKGFTVQTTERPDMDGLDAWMQNLRCTLVDFLTGKPGKEVSHAKAA